MSATIEERLQGKGSLVWIPDPEDAMKYARKKKVDTVEEVACTLNPLIGVAVDHFRRLNFNRDGEIDVVVLAVEGVGDVAVHCQQTVLASQMHAARPKPGEKIGVFWEGERQSGSGRAYQSYRVVVEREHGDSFDWSDGSGAEDAYTIRAPDPEEQKVSGDAPLAGRMVEPDDDVPF